MGKTLNRQRTNPRTLGASCSSYEHPHTTTVAILLQPHERDALFPHLSPTLVGSRPGVLGMLSDSIAVSLSRGRLLADPALARRPALPLSLGSSPYARGRRDSPPSTRSRVQLRRGSVLHRHPQQEPHQVVPLDAQRVGHGRERRARAATALAAATASASLLDSRYGAFPYLYSLLEPP